MTKYAAYDDLSIYGIGDSPEAAIADAQRGDPSADWFTTARISEALFTWIEENGWHGPSRSFDVRGGWIVDTTDAPVDEEEVERMVAIGYTRSAAEYELRTRQPKR